MENLLVYLDGILALRKEEFKTIRRKAQGSGHMGKTCLDPYALSLVPLFINNVSAFQYKGMHIVSQINQII